MGALGLSIPKGFSSRTILEFRYNQAQGEPKPAATNASAYRGLTSDMEARVSQM